MIRIGLAFLLAALCSAVPAVAQVQNPGFETGNFTAWNTAGTGATFAVTSGNQYAGTYCAELTGTDGSLVDMTQEIPCSPNTRYTATLYFKTAGSLVAWDSHLDELDQNHNYAGQTDGLPTPAGSTPAWTMVSKTFTTGPNTRFLMWYNRANIPNGVKLFVDAYALIELGPAGGVTNGGFELGDFSGWSTAGSGATFAVTTGNQRGGTWCAELTGVNWSMISLEQIVSDVLPSTSYTASVWARKTGVWSGSPQPAVDNKILELDANGVYVAGTPFRGLGIPGQGTSAWTKYSTTFTTNAATRKLLWNNNANIIAGDKLFLDDYVLRLTPTCVGMPCNGGFETGEIDFWTTAGSGVSLSVSDGGAGGTRSGDYCVQMTGTTGALFHLEQYFTGPVAGVPYEASAYFRTSAAIIAIGIVLIEHNPAGDIGYSLITGGAENRPGWSKVSVQFTPRAGTTGYTWHNDANVPNGVDLFIDDCKVRPTAQCVGIPCNGGFETGETDFWTTWGSGASFSATGVNPHAGDYALHITGNSANEGVVAPLSGVDQDVTVLPNKTYIATMWYRSAGNWINDAWDSKILVKNASGGILASHPLGVPAALVPNWTLARAIFTTPATAAKITWNNQFNVHSTDHMYLDDLELVEVNTYASYGSIGQLREAGQVPARLDVVVTRAIDESHFFVESPDRSSGILVESVGFPLGSLPSPGDTLRLRGYLAPSTLTDPGNQQRMFAGMLAFRADTTPTPGTPSHVEPLGPLGTTLRPISTKTGPEMEGLLVKVGGMVFNTDMNTGAFEINDSSGPNVRVAYDTWYGVSDGNLVSLTGCVVSSNGVRWIYILPFPGPDEIQFYP